AVTLQMSDDNVNVQGVISGGVVVFEVSVDASGNVTLDQQRAVMHTPDTGPDQSTSLASADLIVLTRSATITDADGDTAKASASINIGQALNFEDDGPDASPKAEVTGSTVLDETGGLDTVTISASDIANLFNAPVYGADGAGSATYALSATDGAGTGLWLTGHSGAANEIKLVKVSDTVYEGREGGGSGALAFTVSINGSSGQVTVQQNATLEHTTDGNTPAAYDDSLSLGGAAAISVVQKVTDGDGDFDTATSANALSISFKDDGPDASPKAEVTGSTVLDETGGLDTVTISASDIANLFNAPVYGADGAGSATYALSATDGAGTGLWLTGHSGAANEIKLVKVSDTVYEGREGGGSGALAFTVSINGSSGQVTVQQNATL